MRYPKDIAGMKFGRLTAIKKVEQKAMEKVQNQYGFADVIVETKKNY